MRKLASLLVAALLPLFSLAAPPLRIGVIGPFSGPSSDFGVHMRNGVMMAAAEVNAVGGYAGRQLELVIMDDRGDPATGLKLAEQMVKENVVATIGYCNTGVAAKAIDVFQAHQMPLIIPCATGSALTSKFPGPESYIFRTSARDSIQAPFIVDDIVRRGWTKVAVFADTTGYGEAGLKDVEKALAEKKLRPVYVARFAIGVQNLDDDLKAARTAGANVILNYTVGMENAVIANGRQALKWKVPVVGAWTLSFPFFIDGAKDAAEGALMAQTFIAEPSNEQRAPRGLPERLRQALQHRSHPGADGRGPGLRCHLHPAVCPFRYPRRQPWRSGRQGGARSEAAHLLRRGGDVRPALQPQRQGRPHAEHARDGRGEEWRRHLCVSGRRQAQPLRAAQAVALAVRAARPFMRAWATGCRRRPCRRRCSRRKPS
jgi:ABC-type branched-subunit amino acid transport system substrate-binding protein